jgi:hypothetical protein
LEVFKLSILNKKNLFNKVHDSFLKKERILEGLLNKYEELSMIELELSDQERLEQKSLECEELETGLKNELAYQETLIFMTRRLKQDNLKYSRPLISLRQKLAEIKTETFSFKNFLMQNQEKLSELEKEVKKSTETLNSLLEYKKRLVKEKSKVYEGKIKLKLSIDQEKDRNFLILKRKKDEKRLKDLEEKLASFRNVELLESEILTFEEFCANEEEKFKKIQKVTNIRKVGEILDHFYYLMGNKDKLLDSLQFSFGQIEKLNDERIKLNEELDFLRFSVPDQGFRTKDVKNIEEYLKRKNNDLENCEEREENLQKIIIFAVNTFAKVSQSLGLEPRLGKIRNSNLENCLKAVCDGLERLLEFTEMDTRRVKEESVSESNESSEISNYDPSSFQFNFN